MPHLQPHLRSRGYVYSKTFRDLPISGALAQYDLEPDGRQLQIGDIGFLKHGVFRPVFNVVQPGKHQINRGRVPRNFVHFELSADSVTIGAMSLNVGEPLQHSIIISHYNASGEQAGHSIFAAKLTLGEPARAVDLKGRHVKDLKAFVRHNIPLWRAWCPDLSDPDTCVITGLDFTAACTKQTYQAVYINNLNGRACVHREKSRQLIVTHNMEHAIFIRAIRAQK